jgi:hypothetical protein
MDIFPQGKHLLGMKLVSRSRMQELLMHVHMNLHGLLLRHKGFYPLPYLSATIFYPNKCDEVQILSPYSKKQLSKGPAYLQFIQHNT